jgi:hypothetical protein
MEGDPSLVTGILMQRGVLNEVIENASDRETKIARTSVLDGMTRR